MNIIVNQNKLLSSLKILERIISKNSSLPILSSILLKTDGGRLRLSATNLEIGITFWIGAKIEAEGEVAVPARVFSDFIHSISTEKVSMSVAQNVLSIGSDQYTTQILCSDASEFPIIPSPRSLNPLKIEKSILKSALASVIDSASLSETRPEFNGIYVATSPDAAIFAATDSFRLSERTVSLQEGDARSFIIPRSAGLEMIRIIDNVDDDIELTVAENQIFLCGLNFQFVSRLIDGHYPEYRRIIPDKFPIIAKANKIELEKTIRMASIFSSEISDINLRAVDQRIEVTAKNTARGEIVSSLPCELTGGDFGLSLNYQYLLDGLKIIPTEYITIAYTGESSPLVIRGENLNNQLYLIMPLRS